MRFVYYYSLILSTKCNIIGIVIMLGVYSKQIIEFFGGFNYEDF